MTRQDPELLLLQQITSSLHELVQFTRIVSYPTVKQILQATLDTEQKRLVYHCLDGTKTVGAIQEETGVNARYISEWGQEWEKIGIVKSSTISERKGRRQKVFDLSTYGLVMPEGALADGDG
jgi:hypothetical protein